MFKRRCQEKLAVFPPEKKVSTIVLLAALFVCGLFISTGAGWEGLCLYMGLWVASYGVIYAGTCRYCGYFGNQCPIPLEGGMVHRFFGKKENGFGYIQLFWAAIAYLLRILVPVIVIFTDRRYGWGTVFLAVFILFWINHLWIIGCPHCVNDRCPMNPGSRGKL